MNILDEIIEWTRRDLEIEKKRVPIEVVKKAALAAPPRVSFADALRGGRNGKPRIIAELKKASPSKGLIRPDFNPASLAAELAEAGAACMSVLTEPHYFQGSPENLQIAAQTVETPLIRKDFIVDEYQIFQAKAWGASAILLIAAALDDEQLCKLYATARELGMDVLAEAHDENEIKRLTNCKCDIIGINARDLKTFKVNLDRLVTMMDLIPETTIRVAESGVKTREDIIRLQSAGADAFLIGETLMRATSPKVELSKWLET